MHDAPRKKAKKQRSSKQQYMLWWKPPGSEKRYFGPVYSKRAVKRDASLYEGMYGEGNAGWEPYDPGKDRPRWRY